MGIYKYKIFFLLKNKKQIICSSYNDDVIYDINSSCESSPSKFYSEKSSNLVYEFNLPENPNLNHMKPSFNKTINIKINFYLCKKIRFINIINKLKNLNPFIKKPHPNEYHNSSNKDKIFGNQTT